MLHSATYREDFNPLPPHGGRRTIVCKNFELPTFQSTPSAWRETGNFFYLIHNIVISIHSLRMEGDKRSCASRVSVQYISIHSLRMEGDFASTQAQCRK